MNRQKGWFKSCSRLSAVIFSTAILLACMMACPCASFSESASEYDIKAGFIYKIISFVQWPDAVNADAETKFIIGILGKSPFGDSFESVEGTKINGKTLGIEYFSKGASAESLGKCQVLYICASEKDGAREVLEAVNRRSVLTISDFPGFADQGGIVNFVQKNGKVRFEINDRAAGKAGLNIRSMMKRLALRIIK